jgi:SAM-dependent methyltransferase
MSDRFSDPDYLRSQYGDAEKLRVRQESHRRYSERPNDAFLAWVVGHLAPRPGELVADVGCGPGVYHPLLAAHGARILAADLSAGMAQAARRLARQERLPVWTLQADAQALPLRGARCARTLAAHVLFHVPDRLAALRELRRVTRPGGRVVLVTVGAEAAGRLRALHVEVARELGYTPEGGPVRFTLDHLDLVRTVFPAAERHVFRNAFVFPTAEAALAYYASGGVDGVRERAPDGSHRARLLPPMEARLRAIIAREGVFRDPKDNGCFVADV